jgi:tRNA nucleotidyltransferase/poly(A) polymerase
MSFIVYTHSFRSFGPRYASLQKFSRRILACQPYCAEVSNTLSSRASVLPRIALSQEEKDLFSLLLRVVEERKLSTTIRVAGGWVRDKLLEIPGKNDIDIALDNLSGVQFMDEMNEWSRKQEKNERNAFSSSSKPDLKDSCNAYKFSIIQRNPEKSKHLETVQVKIDSFSLDFVHLRTEKYSENSRIPIIAAGTPSEDAFRRDLTINSLFYNVNTQQIEDFTGKGLEDLSYQLIRTPLSPLVTFLDDPLRALRAIRFACRFNFHLSSDLLEACSNEEVLTSLKGKVSKERIRHELNLIMKTKSFYRGLSVLYSTKLLHVILDSSNSSLIEDERVNQPTEKHDLMLLEGIVSSLLLPFSASVLRQFNHSNLSSYDIIQHRILKILQQHDNDSLLPLM